MLNLPASHFTHSVRSAWQSCALLSMSASARLIKPSVLLSMSARAERVERLERRRLAKEHELRRLAVLRTAEHERQRQAEQAQRAAEHERQRLERLERRRLADAECVAGVLLWPNCAMMQNTLLFLLKARSPSRAKA